MTAACWQHEGNKKGCMVADAPEPLLGVVGMVAGGFRQFRIVAAACDALKGLVVGNDAEATVSDTFANAR